MVRKNYWIDLTVGDLSVSYSIIGSLEAPENYHVSEIVAKLTTEYK